MNPLHTTHATVFKTLAPGIELRFLRYADANEHFALIIANHEHLRAWLPWVGRDYTLDNSEEFLRNCETQRFENRGFQCGIWVHERLCGVIGFHTIDWPNRKSSLGYWLARDAEGAGLMTRSTIAFVEFAFDVLKLNRLEIRCATGNQRSRAIPERLGFRHEGTLRGVEWLYERFVDHEVYSLLASERHQLLGQKT